jgi:hypothetical protein
MGAIGMIRVNMMHLNAQKTMGFLMQWLSVFLCLVFLAGCAVTNNPTSSSSRVEMIDQQIIDLNRERARKTIADDAYEARLNVLQRHRVAQIRDLNQVLTEQDIAELEGIITQMIPFHKSKLHLEVLDALMIPVRLFESKSEYENYRDANTQSRISNLAFYSSSKNEIVVYKQDNYRSVLIHEAQHFVMRSAFRRTTPKWINEGLSEFFENAYIDGEDLYSRVDETKRKRLMKWLDKGELPALADFLDLTNSEWTEDQRISYTVSWAMVYFLMRTEQGVEVLYQSLDALQNDPHKDYRSAVDESYVGGVAAFDAALRSFIRHMPENGSVLI